MKRSNTTVDIRRFAADPLAFAESLVIQGARGKARFGDIMADFQRERFNAISPALVAVARGEQPPIGRFWWEASKGCSKDSDLAVCILWLLAFSGRPIAAQVGAADQDQADELRKAAKGILHCNPWLAERVRVNVWKIVCSATDAECEIIAADVAGSHGARPDVLILNELSHVSKWEFVENLADNSSKVPTGILIVATNAGSQQHDSYRWREIARTSDRWSFHVWDRPAPWLDAKELEEAERRNPPARFRRLFWGEWSHGLGDCLRSADIDAALAGNVEPIGKAETGWVFVGGLDLSVSRDFTAFVVVGKHALTGRYRVCRLRLWRPPQGGKVDQAEVEAELRQADADYKLAAIGADPFQAEYLISRLKKDRVRIEAVQQSGKSLVTQCLMLLEQFTSNNIDIPSAFKNLEGDLRRLLVEERSYGMRLVSRREAGAGHGDLASALSIALAVAKEAKAKRHLGIGIGSYDRSNFGSDYHPGWNTGHRWGPSEQPDPTTVEEGHVAFNSIGDALNAARQQP